MSNRRTVLQTKPNRKSQPRKTTRKRKNSVQSFFSKLYRQMKRGRFRRAYAGRRRKRVSRQAIMLRSSIALILLIGLVAVFIWFFSNHNVYQVTVGDRVVGMIPLDRELSADMLAASAVTILTSRYDAQVQINETVTIEQVRVSRRADLNSVDEVVSGIHDNLTYRVEAVIVYWQDTREAVLASQGEYEALRNSFISPFITAYTVEYHIVGDVLRYRTEYVEADSIDTLEAARTGLSRTIPLVGRHIVQPGEIIGTIAPMLGLTEAELLEANPDVNPAALRIGQALYYTSTQPLISVQTVDEVRVSQVIAQPPPVHIENPRERINHARVIDPGVEGEEVRTYRVTKINGAETSRVQTGPAVVIREPTPQRIEVGTRRN